VPHADRVIVGLIGLGRMGSAMAQRFAQRGFRGDRLDQNPVAVAALAESGGTTAPHARAVASAAAFVVTTITEDSGVRASSGPDGMLQGDIADTLFIEMSTLQPITVRDLAPTIESHGARIVDAPVLGTIPSVRDGTLVALVGAQRRTSHAPARCSTRSRTRSSTWARSAAGTR